VADTVIEARVYDRRWWEPEFLLLRGQ